jgi:hypothetical protein
MDAVAWEKGRLGRGLGLGNLGGEMKTCSFRLFKGFFGCRNAIQRSNFVTVDLDG